MVCHTGAALRHFSVCHLFQIIPLNIRIQDADRVNPTPASDSLYIISAVYSVLVNERRTNLPLNNIYIRKLLVMTAHRVYAFYKETPKRLNQFPYISRAAVAVMYNGINSPLYIRKYSF